MKDQAAHRTPDWDPLSREAQADQLKTYDAMREGCPVAWSECLHWSLFRHADITRVLLDPETFSNAVSEHLSVPNGMDPPEHTPYRKMIERYFEAANVNAFETIFRGIAQELIETFLPGGELEGMDDFARPFAARAQCAFLGWPADLSGSLIDWTLRGNAAAFEQDRRQLSQLALEFESLVGGQIESRRGGGAASRVDNTGAILRESVRGRSLSNREISSILRNWTVGEIGTISSAIGILLRFLAEREDVQRRLRTDFSLLPAAIDEILRIHGPLVANRRIATRDAVIGGRTIAEGERISLIWVSANRDPRVFDDPEAFRLDRDPSRNLLYGAGIHVCPGAPLARLELRVALEEILAHTDHIENDARRPPMNAVYPASGYSRAPLIVRRRSKAE